MAILHFEYTTESARRLDRLFSSYGWNAAIFPSEHASFLLSLLANDLITVTEVPYEFKPDIAKKNWRIRKLYEQVSRGTRWRSDTFIETDRMNALYQLKLKKYGTPTISVSRYFLYEESHVSALVGNEEPLQLICYLSMFPDIEKWIVFPNPSLEFAAYYIFDITPEARERMSKYYDGFLGHSTVDSLIPDDWTQDQTSG